MLLMYHQPRPFELNRSLSRCTSGFGIFVLPSFGIARNMEQL